MMANVMEKLEEISSNRFDLENEFDIKAFRELVPSQQFAEWFIAAGKIGDHILTEVRKHNMNRNLEYLLRKITPDGQAIFYAVATIFKGMIYLNPEFPFSHLFNVMGANMTAMISYIIVEWELTASKIFATAEMGSTITKLNKWLAHIITNSKGKINPSRIFVAQIPIPELYVPLPDDTTLCRIMKCSTLNMIYALEAAYDCYVREYDDLRDFTVDTLKKIIKFLHEPKLVAFNYRTDQLYTGYEDHERWIVVIRSFAIKNAGKYILNDKRPIEYLDTADKREERIIFLLNKMPLINRRSLIQYSLFVCGMMFYLEDATRFIDELNAMLGREMMLMIWYAMETLFRNYNRCSSMIDVVEKWIHIWVQKISKKNAVLHLGNNPFQIFNEQMTRLEFNVKLTYIPPLCAVKLCKRDPLVFDNFAAIVSQKHEVKNTKLFLEMAEQLHVHNPAMDGFDFNSEASLKGLPRAKQMVAVFYFMKPVNSGLFILPSGGVHIEFKEKKEKRKLLMHKVLEESTKEAVRILTLITLIVKGIVIADPMFPFYTRLSNFLEVEAIYMIAYLMELLANKTVKRLEIAKMESNENIVQLERCLSTMTKKIGHSPSNIFLGRISYMLALKKKRVRKPGQPLDWKTASRWEQINASINVHLGVIQEKVPEKKQASAEHIVVDEDLKEGLADYIELENRYKQADDDAKDKLEREAKEAKEAEEAEEAEEKRENDTEKATDGKNEVQSGWLHRFGKVTETLNPMNMIGYVLDKCFI